MPWIPVLGIIFTVLGGGFTIGVVVWRSGKTAGVIINRIDTMETRISKQNGVDKDLHTQIVTVDGKVDTLTQYIMKHLV